MKKLSQDGHETGAARLRTFARIALFGAPLLLAACASDFGPYPFPSGYKHQNAEYKAPPGPEPVFKKWRHRNDASAPAPQMAASAEMPADNMMAPAETMPAGSWDVAASDLVDRLVRDFGHLTEGLYMEVRAATVDEMNFENALRAAMTAKGFKIVQNGYAPFSVEYAVRPLGYLEESRVMLSVVLKSGGRTATQASGVYAIDGLQQQAAAPVAAPVFDQMAPDQATMAPASSESLQPSGGGELSASSRTLESFSAADPYGRNADAQRPSLTRDGSSLPEAGAVVPAADDPLPLLGSAGNE